MISGLHKRRACRAYDIKFYSKIGDMEKMSIHLSMILLAFFALIISSNAIPSTRMQRALQTTGESLSLPKIRMEEDGIRGRLDLQLNDYQTGANNRHTPKPPGRS